MRTFGTFSVALVAIAATAVPARADSVAREGITCGALTRVSEAVVVGRAEGRSAAGSVELLSLAVTETLKGEARGTLSVVLTRPMLDLREGDELVGFLRRMPGERLGLVSGDYWAPVGLPDFTLLRVTGESRGAWVDGVRAHLTGDAGAVTRWLAAAAVSGDRRIAGDAVVDLAMNPAWSGGMTAPERSALAGAFFGPGGRVAYRNEAWHVIRVLGQSGAVEAYGNLVDLVKREPLTGTADAVGEALGRLDRERAAADLSGLLRGTPEERPSAELRVKVLEVVRSFGGRELVPAVQETLREPEEAVRRWAAVTLGWLGDPGSVASLVTMLEGGPGDDPMAAAYGLHRIAEESGLSALRRAAGSHARPEVRAWLARFLANPAMVGEDVLVKLVRGY